MSAWLPPGCTDKDIDDAANGDVEQRRMTFLANDGRGLIVFEAACEDDAKAICSQEGWRYLGEGDEDDL